MKPQEFPNDNSSAYPGLPRRPPPSAPNRTRTDSSSFAYSAGKLHAIHHQAFNPDKVSKTVNFSKLRNDIQEPRSERVLASTRTRRALAAAFTHARGNSRQTTRSPAFTKFYDLLSDEQKARLNSLRYADRPLVVGADFSGGRGARVHNPRLLV
jgi:hypothetical protein